MLLHIHVRSIPYKLIGATKFYDRAEIRDAIAYLRLLAFPFDDMSFLRVIGKPRRSSTEPLGTRTYKNPKAFASLLGYWSQIYSSAGIEKTLDSQLATSECEKKGEKA